MASMTSIKCGLINAIVSWVGCGGDVEMLAGRAHAALRSGSGRLARSRVLTEIALVVAIEAHISDAEMLAPGEYLYTRIHGGAVCMSYRGGDADWCELVTARDAAGNYRSVLLAVRTWALHKPYGRSDEASGCVGRIETARGALAGVVGSLWPEAPVPWGAGVELPEASETAMEVA